MSSSLCYYVDWKYTFTFDPRLIEAIPPAVAKAAMESGVATQPIENWQAYEDELYARMGNDNKIVRLLINRARTNPKKIVFAEADHLDVLKAAQIVFEEVRSLWADSRRCIRCANLCRQRTDLRGAHRLWDSRHVLRGHPAGCAGGM